MHVDLLREPELIRGAAALFAEDAEAVGVVQDGENFVFGGDGGDLRQAADVAFHRVNALDDEQLGGGAGRGRDDLPEVLGIVVRESLDRGR